MTTPVLTELKNVRLLRASPHDDGATLDESLVRRCSGGEPIKARALPADFWTSGPVWSIYSLRCPSELNGQFRDLCRIDLERDGQAFAYQRDGEAGFAVWHLTLATFYAADWKEGGVVSAYFSSRSEDGRRRACCGHGIEADATSAILFGRCPDCNLSGIDLHERLLALRQLCDSGLHKSLRADPTTSTGTVARGEGGASAFAPREEGE